MHSIIIVPHNLPGTVSCGSPTPTVAYCLLIPTFSLSLHAHSYYSYTLPPSRRLPTRHPPLPGATPRSTLSNATALYLRYRSCHLRCVCVCWMSSVSVGVRCSVVRTGSVRCVAWCSLYIMLQLAHIHQIRPICLSTCCYAYTTSMSPLI